jgi:sulfur-oxidizing protein SoxB
VQEGVQGTAEPIWDVVGKYLRDKKVIGRMKLNQPKLIGMENNPSVVL